MWEQIRSNRRRSALLVAVVAALLLSSGYALGELFVPGGGAGGLVVACALWVILTGIAYFQGDRIFLALTGARQIRKADHPQLFNLVEEMTIASGLPAMPKVYVIDEPLPNAFATGRKPGDACVAVTTGLLERLDRDELQGVIAHEIGHVKNRDILFMLMVGVMIGAIVMLADVSARALWYGGRHRRTSRDSPGHPALAIIGLLLVILAPILAQLLYMACSRRREYLADASGALFTRYPEGLASALEKIAVRSHSPMAKANRALAPMYIVNPLEQAAAAFDARGLFSTHPPTDLRVRVLRAMGGASLADYERAWEATTGRRTPIIGKRSLGEEDATAGSGPIRREPPAVDSPERHLRRAREATDLVWRLQGYRRVSCPCGATLKVPPDLPFPDPVCPRCRRQHAVDRTEAV